MNLSFFISSYMLHFNFVPLYICFVCHKFIQNKWFFMSVSFPQSWSTSFQRFHCYLMDAFLLSISSLPVSSVRILVRIFKMGYNTWCWNGRFKPLLPSFNLFIIFLASLVKFTFNLNYSNHNGSSNFSLNVECHLAISTKLDSLISNPFYDYSLSNCFGSRRYRHVQRVKITSSQTFVEFRSWLNKIIMHTQTCTLKTIFFQIFFNGS